MFVSSGRSLHVNPVTKILQSKQVITEIKCITTLAWNLIEILTLIIC